MDPETVSVLKSLKKVNQITATIKHDAMSTYE
jgi:hypothetical protein